MDRYGGSPDAPPAVTVRSDGSASLLWPEGGVACTLDRAPDAGGGYRLLAMHRSVVCVAASWDSGGGFAQWPNGGLALVWGEKDGSGAAYEREGGARRALRRRRRGSAVLAEPLQLVLDQHLTVLLSPLCSSLTLAFECDGVAMRVSTVHGALCQHGGGTAVRVIDSVGPRPGDCSDGDDTADILARARALVAASETHLRTEEAAGAMSDVTHHCQESVDRTQ